MDALQQALRRAREAQQGKEDFAPVTASADPRTGESASDTVVARSRTPVVRLDPAHLRRHCITTGQADDPLTAPFDLLRTKVMQTMRSNGWRTLAVLSADDDEGKTVTAVNLAMSVAKLPSHTAMLLDLNLRQPGLLATLGYAPDYCMEDWLAGTCEFSRTLFSPGMERLIASGVRAPIAGAAEILASRRISGQIDELASRYEDRIIVVDMPPMLVSDDVLVLIPHIDCFLVVVAAGQTLGHRLRECLSLIPPGRLIGTVLNKSLR